jgi:succinate-acetate transporter protein
MSSEGNKLRPTTTAGGHVEDAGQPALPVVHRRFANPSPLGLLSFATGTVPYHTNGLFGVPVS